MKLTKLNLLVAVGLVLLLSSPAQSQFVKTLGGGDNDYGNEVIQTSDGEFVVTGYTYSFGAGDADLLLARYDTYGNLLWIRSLGGSGDDRGYSVIEASDGGFVVTGYTKSFGGSDKDFLLAKFDATGNHLWTKTLGGSSDDYSNAVIEAADGGLVVTGMTFSYDIAGGDGDLLLAKFDASGNHLWTKTIGGTYGESGQSLIQASDSGFVVTGQSWASVTDFDLLLAKFDASGNHLWTKTLEGSDDERGYSVIETSDSGLVVTGYTENFGAGDRDLLIVKFDASGDTLWTRSLGGTQADYGFSVIEASDGGFVVAGYTYSFGAGGQDFLLAKFDSTGDTLWTWTLGGTDNEVGNSVVEASDGGFVATGYAESFGAGDRDLLLARFDADGNTCSGGFVSAEFDSGSPPTDIPTWTPYSRSPTITSPDPTITTPDPTLTTVCEVSPRILSITDVGNDQGRQVRVKWHRCYYDSEGSPVTIPEYSLWRRIDEDKGDNQSNEILSSNFGMLDGGRLYPPGEWDFIKTVPARGESTYNTVCPTLGDSTMAEGMYWSVFFVSAMTSDPLVYYDSEPDSGYSLDNIPPIGVENLDIPRKTGQTLVLTWMVPGEYPGEQPTTAYDIRYSNGSPGADTAAWWDAATECEGEPYPAPAGQVDSFMVTLDLTQTYYIAMKLLDDRPNYSEISNIVRFTCGDANADTIVDIGDVLYLINYLFTGTSPPDPMAAGDVNCDGEVDTGDIIYLINYLFTGTSPPCSP